MKRELEVPRCSIFKGDFFSESSPPAVQVLVSRYASSGLVWFGSAPTYGLSCCCVLWPGCVATRLC